MAEQNITCPHCLSDKQCFQEEVKVENFSSYQCFNCGFMSNSLYTNDSDALKRIQDSTTDLMNEISFYDYDRKIHWFPTILNMGKFGMIYPEGTKDNWSWKFASVRKLTEEEQKNPMYEGHEHTLDIENSREYGQYEFINACKDMGIVKEGV